MICVNIQRLDNNKRFSMAEVSSENITDGDIEEICQSMRAFVKLSGKKDNLDIMNSKACGKIVKDALPKEVVTIADASVFPKHKEKGKPNMNLKDKKAVKGFVCDCAYEYAKQKCKNNKLPRDDPEVKKIEREFADKLKKANPSIKEVKTSKTGNVCGLTDTKQYTGTHKERFDEEGKGKGKEGRVDIPDDSGYVQAYKEKGTYDETH